MEETVIVKKMSRVGILGNILLAGFKLLAGVLGKSGAMVSDAVHSLSDVFATFIAYFGVRLAGKPEDEEHPYGHERIESLASLFLGLILAGTGLGIGYTGLQKLFAPEKLEVPTLLPLIAAVVSIAVKEAMYQYTMRFARKLNSSAFRADAWHHRSDALSSIGSFIGIGLARLGFPIMDPIASLIICLFILKVAYDISRDAVAKVLDTSCSPEWERDLRQFVEKDPGVERIDLLHTRQFGSRIYIELEIAVDRNMSLINAHTIAERVHESIERQYPAVKHVMVHVNPGDEK